MIPLTERKQQLSIAYLRALCAKAGCSLTGEHSYDCGVDATLIKVDEVDGKPWEPGVHLNIQLKCSSEIHETNQGTTMSYAFKKKYYNKLAKPLGSERSVRTILLVLQVSDNFEDNIYCDSENLILKKCAYWEYLEGQPLETSNLENNKTIRIPKSQLMTVEKLLEMLNCLEEGGSLNECR